MSFLIALGVGAAVGGVVGLIAHVTGYDGSAYVENNGPSNQGGGYGGV